MTKTAKKSLSKLEELRDKNSDSKENSRDVDVKDSAKTGLPAGWTRATLIVREEHKQKLDEIAFWGQIALKDVLDEILENFFADKNIPPIPKMGRDQILKFFDKKKPKDS
jgi:hypothetical protein